MWISWSRKTKARRGKPSNKNLNSGSWNMSKLFCNSSPFLFKHFSNYKYKVVRKSYSLHDNEKTNSWKELLFLPTEYVWPVFETCEGKSKILFWSVWLIGRLVGWPHTGQLFSYRCHNHCNCDDGWWRSREHLPQPGRLAIDDGGPLDQLTRPLLHQLPWPHLHQLLHQLLNQLPQPLLHQLLGPLLHLHHEPQPRQQPDTSSICHSLSFLGQWLTSTFQKWI